MWIGDSIKTMTRSEKIKLLKTRWSAIHYIDDPDIELQMVAVQTDPQALSCIRQPSHRVMIYAIMHDPSSILLVKDVPRSLMEFAVSRYPTLVLSLKDLDRELAELALSLDFNLRTRLENIVSVEAYEEAGRRAKEYWDSKDRDEEFYVILIKKDRLDLLSKDDIRNNVDVSNFYEVLSATYPPNTTINDLFGGGY